MKKYLLFILTAFVFLSSVAMAQPTLTATGINPVVGETYSFKYYSGTASPGNSGANQNWTFTPPISSIFPTQYHNWLPSSTPYGNSFLSANCSAFDGTYYKYYETSPLVLGYYGIQGPNYIANYPDPEELLHFPFNMGDSYTDTWSGVNDQGPQTGTTTVTYDGYGSLTLPTGTFNNVARVHLYRTFAMDPGGPIIYQNQYNWYLNGYHNPIAYIILTTNSNDFSGILMNISTQVNEKNSLSSYIISYPNPATNEINFELSNALNAKQIEIADITGKIVYSEPVSQNTIENVITINTSDFKDGIYFAKFKLEDGQSVTKKINIIK